MEREKRKYNTNYVWGCVFGVWLVFGVWCKKPEGYAGYGTRPCGAFE